MTWYGSQTACEGRNFEALAVIVPLLERMQVASIIDKHLPADPQAEFPLGRVLTLLIAARLYSPLALINVPAWAEQTGADILWGIPPEKMNDDRLEARWIRSSRSVIPSWHTWPCMSRESSACR